MLGFRLPVISDNIVTLFFGMLDPENVGIGVGISFLSHSEMGQFLPPPTPVILEGLMVVFCEHILLIGINSCYWRIS